MNENDIVKVHEFDTPLIQMIDSIIDDSIRDCLNNYFHTFDYICDYDLTFTNIGNNETVNFTSSDKSMASDELNKKLTIARRNGFIFNQINKLTKQNYINLSNINMHYYLKLRIPIMHRHFCRKFSQNLEYIQTHCNI